MNSEVNILNLNRHFTFLTDTSELYKMHIVQCNEYVAVLPPFLMVYLNDTYEHISI